MSAVVAELVKILPENEFLRAGLIALFIIVVPVKPAIWVGQGLRYSVRWVRCQVFGRHSWVQVMGVPNIWGQPMSGTAQCRVCLKSFLYGGPD